MYIIAMTTYHCQSNNTKGGVKMFYNWLLSNYLMPMSAMSDKDADWDIQLLAQYVHQSFLDFPRSDDYDEIYGYIASDYGEGSMIRALNRVWEIFKREVKPNGN